MNKEFKAKWLAALRSGEYKQTEGRLRRQQKDGSWNYCCLGVACDVLKPDGWGTIENGEGPSRNWAWHYTFADPELGSTAYLPEDLGDLIGVDMTWQSRLSIRNDNGETFEQIADLIERGL